ncbi:MAG: GNAT family N-acetyltransferase [Clostridia bacterium]|nr:GNAT family N-acetyltransferase [Clostridia bacterium]
MISARNYLQEDDECYRKMTYEAVFWDQSKNPPEFSEAMVLDFVQPILNDFPNRKGDLGVTALQNNDPIGAVWIRYWNKQENMRGYYKNEVPVLVIGVHETYRKSGIGVLLIRQLLEQCKEKGISEVSLCVSKKNHAKKLYDKCGF